MDKKILIPNTDISIYPMGLGTVDAGLGKDPTAVWNVIDAYLELGGNLIDTAHVYSDWIPGERARSERIIGDWIANSGKRDQIVLMTKGGHPEMDSSLPNYLNPRMTKEDMTTDLDSSLKQLRTDRIDIYFYHRDHREQTVEEEIETMESFVKAGKIRYYACSNWDADRMEEASKYCGKQGYRGFVADQSLYNLGMKYMDDPEDKTLRCTRGAAFDFHLSHPEVLEMPFFGNCSGYFQKYLKKGADSVKGMNYDTPKNRMVAERLRLLTEKYHCSVTQAVMGFFRFQPFVCVPLYGTSSPEHLKDACGALDIPFTKEDYENLLNV